MAAKTKWWKGAWWLLVHALRQRSVRRIGTTSADKRKADDAAAQANAALALGLEGPALAQALGFAEPERTPETPEPVPFGPSLREWPRRHSVTFTPSYVEPRLGVIEGHLEPPFGTRDLREIREADLLDFVKATLEDDYAPATILNALSIVRRALNLAVRDGLIARNPALGVGRLIARVSRGTASEVKQVDSWTRTEVETLLQLAEQHERCFAPLLRFLLSTGARRGEAMGLRWEDVDFERSRVTIRRALTRGQAVTPKSGRARTLAMPPSLTAALAALLGQRRKEC